MVQILFAILAGILTIAAPCILPLLPILLGVSVGQTNKTRPLFIVAGFVLIFSLAALLISFLTRHLGLDPNIIRTIGIAALAIFGLLMIWPLPFELLAIKMNSFFAKASVIGGTGRGNLGGFFLGMTLGIVWTPCAGPVLASVLTLVALQKESLTALILLLAYACGAGIPMLIIAYSGQYLTTRITSLAKYSRLLQIIFGVIIILLAVALYFSYDTQIYAKIIQYYPSFNPKY
jgi:cytochrome c-type biogenesis protein